VEHLRQVYRLKRTLSHGHVPFEFFTEDDLTPARLERCRVLILPQTLFIGDGEVTAIRGWVAGGGILLLTGALPAYYDNAKPRPSPAFSDWFPGPAAAVETARVGKGKAAWAPRVPDVAPLPEVEAKLLETSASRLVEALGRVTAPGPQPAAPLLPLLSKLSGKSFQVVDRADLPGLRASAYWQEQADRMRIVLHLVNYEVTAKEDPVPARNVDLKVLPPRGGPWRTVRAQTFSPGLSGGARLDAQIRGGYFTLRVPEVRTYTVVEASLGL
jgi:hypothetical protein